ncbi:hypothetical protein J6590_022620 [Homalodisca vitripennis]|nr:hypothetical protein J6590_022620 [Homalodisca vitripennis]
MSPEKFYELLNMLRPFIEKQDTYFRPVQTRPVSPEERLAVCLSCLWSGVETRDRGEGAAWYSTESRAVCMWRGDPINFGGRAGRAGTCAECPPALAQLLNI